MIERLDQFALMFDSLTPDASATPSLPPQPGYALLDDANGRFEIDAQTGVITLANDSMLADEYGAVHVARVQVTEPSGAHYELTLPLQITAHVPPMVGAEPLLSGDAPTPKSAKPRRARSFAQFAAFAADADTVAPLGDDDAPFGALVAPATPIATLAPAILNLAAAAPGPSPRAAAWSL